MRPLELLELALRRAFGALLQFFGAFDLVAARVDLGRLLLQVPVVQHLAARQMRSDLMSSSRRSPSSAVAKPARASSSTVCSRSVCSTGLPRSSSRMTR